MGENLVIVESPAKAKTIEKFLGEGYTVKSSFGHIRDLKTKGLGVDVEGGFSPQYEIPSDKKKLVAELKAAAKKASVVWLASDEDREGEAIAWHLYDVLGLKEDNTRRIVFHEITKPAILAAIENPRSIDMDLVMAQQARRVLDRLVGFELSPVLWKKVQKGLSAGRVQSVALRLIVDREREIAAFESKADFRVEAVFSQQGGGRPFKAVLDKRFSTEKEAEEFLEKCRNASFAVSDISTKEGTRTPAPPFTTSSLQQEAARKLGFSVSQTMSIAQKLYEAGLITYMRTDSTNLSSLAINTAKQVISELYGEKYSKVRNYKTKAKGAQEAHEAIRPTYIANRTVEGSAAEQRLYNLIWKRTVACQMADAKVEKTTVTVGSPSFPELFLAEGETITFDGFLKVYAEGRDDVEEEDTVLLPKVGIGESLDRIELSALEKFSQRPARYSEASLVRKMEELGIGRPSTYAPTITTIINRGYIVKGDKEGSSREAVTLKLEQDAITRTVKKEIFGAEKKKLLPENIGIVVTDFLVANFNDILDYGFTAGVEDEFDRIASGKLVWNKQIGDFYGPFHKQVERISEKGRLTSRPQPRMLGTDPATGKAVYAKFGPYGPMVQLGETDDPDRRYASMLKGQLIETIALEEALNLFKLPRTVGSYQDKPIVASIGRFGPYIRYDGRFISLKNGYDPYNVTEEQAISLIAEDVERKENKPIAEFKEEGIQILNGRYGPYVKKDNKNYKIPRGTDAYKLTIEDCLSIIDAAGSASGKRIVRMVNKK